MGNCLDLQQDDGLVALASNADVRIRRSIDLAHQVLAPLGTAVKRGLNLVPS